MKTKLERFTDKIEKTDSCWNWKGALGGSGYGQFWDGKIIPAHWFLLVKRPSKGEEACHTCDNKLCVRPSHIFIGTRSDNMKDCSSKGRLRFQNGLKAANAKPKTRHRGVSNHESKLTEEQAILASACPRRYGAASKMAKAFGVSVTVICDIRDGKRWSYLPDPDATAAQRSEAFLKTLGLWKSSSVVMEKGQS